MFLSFISGLALGLVIAIFVYRNNKKILGKYADKVDELWDKLSEDARSDSSKTP